MYDTLHIAMLSITHITPHSPIIHQMQTSLIIIHKLQLFNYFTDCYWFIDTQIALIRHHFQK